MSGEKRSRARGAQLLECGSDGKEFEIRVRLIGETVVTVANAAGA
jgi:hypothetical protein